MNFSELLKYTGLKDSRDVGKFTYHLKTLLRTGLIEYSSKTRLYSLTPLGKNVVKILNSLYKVSMSGGMVAQKWDYSMELIDRNSIAEFVAEAVRLPTDLARRVSILVEKRLEELNQFPIHRWLVEDLVRLELFYSNVPLERLSNISPMTPSIHELFKIFQNCVEKHDIVFFNRYLYHTVMNRLVVEKLFPRQLKNHYYLGEIDIHHSPWTVTHIFSLALDATNESSIIKLAPMVFNDLVIMNCPLGEHPSLPASDYGLPQAVYRVVEGSARKIKEVYPSHSLDSRWQKVLDWCEWADVVRVGVPFKLSHPCLCTFYQDGRVHLTQYVINTLAREVFGIHAFIGVNLMRLVIFSGFDESTLLGETTTLLERSAKYLERSTNYLHRVQKGSSKIQLFYLLVPVGLVEALKFVLKPASKEEEYLFFSQALRILSQAVENVAFLRGKVFLASIWPRSISDRMHCIDQVAWPKQSDTKYGAVQTEKYVCSLSELLSAMDVAQLREIVRSLGSVTLEYGAVDSLIQNLGRESAQDVLVSLPILLHASPQLTSTTS